MAQVIEILISSAANAPMQPCSEILAVAGRGLEGDRYFLGLGTFSSHPQKPPNEVTLIEQENLDTFRTESGLPFTSREARRNIVTRGIDLNALVGKQFQVGEVLLQGLKLCEPCNHLARNTFPQVLPGLIGKGGLRAQILRGGILRAGDHVRASSGR